MPQVPRPLFLRTTSLTCLLYLFVSSLRGHLCAPTWYIVRFSDSLQYSVILCATHHHLLATFPQLKAPHVPIHILKVGSIPFSFCRKLKLAIIIRAIQVSDAPSNLPCSFQVLPSQGIYLEVPQILAFLNPSSLGTFFL